MQRALVCGAGGFIGSHLVRALKRDGWSVRGVDVKFPEFSPSAADEFLLLDLRDRESSTCPAVRRTAFSSSPPRWGAWASSVPPRATSCTTACS